MTVTLVVAVADNGVIGRDGGMPWPPTGDQRQFKELTTGHPMVMGRTTYESIGRPLPGRTSIVLTRDPHWSAAGVIVAHDLPAALARGRELDDEVFLIGGAEVYRAALRSGLVDRLVVTHVHQMPTGDTRFDPIDPSIWRETSREQYDGYDIVEYIR